MLKASLTFLNEEGIEVFYKAACSFIAARRRFSRKHINIISFVWQSRKKNPRTPDYFLKSYPVNPEKGLLFPLEKTKRTSLIYCSVYRLNRDVFLEWYYLFSPSLYVYECMYVSRCTALWHLARMKNGEKLDELSKKLVWHFLKLFNLCYFPVLFLTLFWFSSLLFWLI